MSSSIDARPDDSFQSRPTATETPSTLPSFTSVRDGPVNQPLSSRQYSEYSHAESSTSGSRRRTRQYEELQQDTSPSIQSSTRNDKRSISNEAPAELTPPKSKARRSKRSSGGFLLEGSRLTRSLLEKRDGKGKQKEGSQRSATSKAESVGSNISQRSRSHISPRSASMQSVSPSPQLSGHRKVRIDQAPSSADGHGASNTAQSTHVYGFDHDPLQIVQMALRLNEGKRRQASGKRYVSTSMNKSRAVSAANSIPAQTSAPATTIGQYISTYRRPSVPSPQLAHGTIRKRPHSEYATQQNPPGIAQPEQDLDVSDEDEMPISRATAHRVEKAKIYFELAYEYRRLLSHLPPLHDSTSKTHSAPAELPTRQYNPLQYARNRKLRFRERMPVQGEASGWTDVPKVRAWVDAIIEQHPNVRHDPLECVRLPPLSLKEDSDDDDHILGSPSKSRPNPTPDKPRRPKSDWVTSPCDWLADAFWCEQGLNKLKIYNRDNDPIFPPGTQLRFSGWRNRTPLNVPDYLQYSPNSPDNHIHPHAKEEVTAQPDLPTFESAHKDHNWSRKKFKKKLVKRDSSTHKKLAAVFDSSASSSPSSADNSASDSDRHKRGRNRRDKYANSRTMRLADGDPFTSHKIESAAKPPSSEPRMSSEIDSSAQGSSKRNSVDHARFLKYLHRNSVSKHSQSPSEDHEDWKKSRKRALLQTLKIHDPDRPRSSAEYESTAPNSPVAYGLPSIAINLSPPISRSVSPNKRARSSILESSSKERDKENATDNIDTTDFAQKFAQPDKNISHDSSTSNNNARHVSPVHGDSRDTSPMTRGASPFTQQRTSLSQDDGRLLSSTASTTNADPRQSVASRVSTRTSDSRDHRIRGIFKGGRIAELVGHEVSRVGDFIWKRDPPRQRTTDDGSVSGYESDSDSLPDTAGVANSPSDGKPSPAPRSPPTLRRVTSQGQSSPITTSEDRERQSEKSSPFGPAQYHIAGLPSFVSPFQRDRDAQERKTQIDRERDQSSGATPPIKSDKGIDHISLQAAHHRSASRSPRLDRLAPPKLNIEDTSLSDSDRRQSYGFGKALALERTKSASQLFNSAVNDQGKLGSQLSLVPTQNGGIGDDSDLAKGVSHPDRRPATVFQHELLRTRAMLLVTAVKASNIARYCEAVPPTGQSAFLVNALHTADSSHRQDIRRRDEHSLAARELIQCLTTRSSSFTTHLDTFSRTTVQDLHREIQILEDKVENTLTPRVRDISDRAGRLAQSLTTTSTLAVRDVNDQVVDATRLKRRAGLKLGRRMVYKVIEGSIVGLLWLIWAIATIVRFAVGTVQLVVRVIAWLLWLD